MSISIFFIFISMTACILASTYLIRCGNRMAGYIFILSFILGPLSGYLIGSSEMPENYLSCMRESDFFICGSMQQKVGRIIGLVSSLLLALAIYIIAITEKGRKIENDSS